MAFERIHFIPPVIEDNPNGWGPTSVSDAFKGIPYQPFSKGDKLGKVKYFIFHKKFLAINVFHSDL